MKRPLLRWRKQPNETGLARVCQTERGYELRCGQQRVGGAYPHHVGFGREKDGYYCSGRWDEMGVPLLNTASRPVKTIEEAKEQLMAHFREHIDRFLEAQRV